MRKRVVSILLTAAMSAMLFTGCSTPTEAPTSSAKDRQRQKKIQRAVLQDCLPLLCLM